MTKPPLFFTMNDNGFTVAELQSMISKWPTHCQDGQPARVLLLDADRRRFSPVVTVTPSANDAILDGIPGDVHLVLSAPPEDGPWIDEHDNASPLEVALAVCSYWRNTPAPLFNPAYFTELVSRAESGLIGVAMAEESLHMTPDPPTLWGAVGVFAKALRPFGIRGAWTIASAYLDPLP